MVGALAIVEEVFSKESELKKCRRSLLIHYVDKWVKADKETEGYGLAYMATASVHKLTCGMVTVQEVFPLGQGKMGQPPTSVYKGLCQQDEGRDRPGKWQPNTFGRNFT